MHNVLVHRGIRETLWTIKTSERVVFVVDNCGDGLRQRDGGLRAMSRENDAIVLVEKSL